MTMCGIIGYVGHRDSSAILVGGLRRLEYRGYDSAGIAVLSADGQLGMRKRAGKLRVLADNLDDAPIADGGTGIGHTQRAMQSGQAEVDERKRVG